MQLLNKIELKEWQDFLKEYPHHSIFHIPEIHSFYQNHINTKPCSVFVTENSSIKGAAIGEINNQSWDLLGMTKRTVFYSEPIYNQDLEVLDLLLKGIKQNSKGIFIQIRNSKMQSDTERQIYMNNGFLFKDHLNAIIKLENKETVWQGIEKDKKKGIKKARDIFGIQIIEKSDMQGIEIFYELQKKLYRRKNHPINSKSYFQDMLNYLGKGRVRIYFAVYKNEKIATQLAFFYNGVITALYTSTAAEHQNKKAGDLLIWHLIETGFKEGYRIFDFGGAGSPQKKYGPRDYKKRFGCTFENIGRFIYIKKKISYFFLENAYNFFLRN